MTAIKAHYGRRPVARSSALEVLNALATCAAVTIQGASPDELETRAWFLLALDQQVMEPLQ